MAEHDEPIDLDRLTTEDMPQIEAAHFEAIGRVVDACAGLDLSIDFTIWELLKVDQLDGACVTAQFISIHPRLKALIALARINGATTSADELASFYGEAGGLADRRNRLIHDKRLVNYHTKEVVRFGIATKKSLEFGSKLETIDELNTFAEKMKSMTEKFETIAEKVRKEISTSRRTPELEKERAFRLRRPPKMEGPAK